MRGFVRESWDEDSKKNWRILLEVHKDSLSERFKNSAQESAESKDPSKDSPGNSEIHRGDCARSIMSTKPSAGSGIGLPENIRSQIRGFIENVVRDLVKKEVDQCFREQIELIERMSAEELMRLAS